jgi:hypothetical protein
VLKERLPTDGAVAQKSIYKTDILEWTSMKVSNTKVDYLKPKAPIVSRVDRPCRLPFPLILELSFWLSSVFGVLFPSV